MSPDFDDGAEKTVSPEAFGAEDTVQEELKNCLHCNAGSDDLSIEVMLIGYKDSEEPEAERKMVYCSGCGHLGDLDTWNERPEVKK